MDNQHIFIEINKADNKLRIYTDDGFIDCYNDRDKKTWIYTRSYLLEVFVKSYIRLINIRSIHQNNIFVDKDCMVPLVIR